MQCVEKGLVPIYQHFESGETLVNARELHEFLGSNRQFANWIKYRIDTYGFVEGIDFLTKMLKSTGGRPALEYFLTIDMAKELAMVENNERGREVRRYFIEVEKKFQQLIQTKGMVLPQNFSEALRMLADTYDEKQRLAKEVETMKPKVIAFDAYMDSVGGMPLGEAAKSLGLGRNRLMAILRKYKILDDYNIPYQQYLNRDLFDIIQQQSQGVRYTKTMVLPKGLEFIRKLLNKMEEKELVCI